MFHVSERVFHGKSVTEAVQIGQRSAEDGRVMREERDANARCCMKRCTGLRNVGEGLDGDSRVGCD